MTELIFSIVMSSQYAFCCKLFSRNFPKSFRKGSSKNTAVGMLLILSDYSFKICGTPFNPFRPGGNKRSHILKKTLN